MTKSLYQFSMQSPGQGRSCTPRPRSSTKKIAKLPGVEDVTSDVAVQHAAGQRDHRPRQGRGHAASTPTRSRTRSTTPTVRAGSPPSTARSTSTRCCWNWSREYQADPRALSLLYFKNTDRQADPARHAGQDRDRDRAADHQPLRPAPVGHDFVQPASRARRSARWSTQIQDVADRRAARHHQHAVPGRGQGVPEFAGQPVGAADHRHPGGVHRARHSVRELHPPAHDSLRPAVGRLRRAADAVDLPHGPEHLRVRRTDHADRHRGEERHHADRLRAGSRAPARPARRRRRSTKAA